MSPWHKDRTDARVLGPRDPSSVCTRTRGESKVDSMRRIGKLVGGVLLAVGVIGIIFVAGMRAKSRPVLDAVRKTGRATKGFVLKSSGTPGGIASVVRHVGQLAGRTRRRCRPSRPATGS